MTHDRKPSTLTKNLNAKIAALPMIATALIVFVGCSLWTISYSFTSSNSLPVNEFVGLAQYERLFRTSRWMRSLENLAIYGVLNIAFALVVGFVLAALLDQKVRFENAFRTIFLYPFALSFIVTGLVWQWILNPTFGIEHIVRSLGFETFTFAPSPTGTRCSTRSSSPACGRAPGSSWPSCSPASGASTRRSGRRPGWRASQPGGSTCRSSSR